MCNTHRTVTRGPKQRLVYKYVVCNCCSKFQSAESCALFSVCLPNNFCIAICRIIATGVSSPPRPLCTYNSYKVNGRAAHLPIPSTKAVRASSSLMAVSSRDPSEWYRKLTSSVDSRAPLKKI